MSISDFLKFGQDEREKENLRNAGKITAGIGLGYYAATQTGVGGRLKNALDLNRITRRGNELGDTGSEIRGQLDQVKNLLADSKINALNAFKETVLNDSRLDEILNKTATEEGKQEVRAFLESVFDSVRYQNSAEDEQVEMLLKKLYENPESIEETQKETLKNFYKSRIEKDQKLLERFRGRFNQNLRVKNLLSDAVREADPSFNKIQMQQINYQELNTVFGDGIANKIQGRLNKIRGFAGSNVNFKLVGFNEAGDGGIKSLYARTQINNRYLNIPLYLERGKNGLIYYRATENLSTRYAAPLGIIDSKTLFGTGSSSTILGNPEQTLRKSFIDFEDHIINIAEQRFAGRQSDFQNLSKQELNAFMAYQRSLGTDVPRGMVAGASNLDPVFQNNLAISRAVQSNILKIVGLESMSRRERKGVTESLIRRFPGAFGATIGAQTAETRLDDPFGGSDTRVVQSIEMRQDRDVFKGNATAGKSITPFNLLKTYNRIDRSVQPLVAREQQMHGRYEMAKGFARIDGGFSATSFGRSRIPAVGTGSSLLGVNPGVGKNYSTVNVGAIMAFEDSTVATKLGLAEGMSYSGGKVIVRSGQQKTVIQEGLGSTPLLQRVIKEGSVRFEGKEGIKKLFNQYGDREGLAVLGTLDGRLTGVRNYEGLQGVTIELAEESIETGRKRFHLNVMLDREVGGSKFFGPIIKDTVLETNQSGMLNKLAYLDKAMNSNGFYSNLGLDYFNQYKGAIENTLLTTTATTSKSPQYLKMQIEGGLKIVGDFSGGMNFTKTSDEELIQLINSRRLANNQISSLEQASAKEMAGANLGDFIRQVSRMSSDIGLGGREFGSVMSYAYELAVTKDKKFGMNRQFFERMVREGAGDFANFYLEEAESFRRQQIVIGGSSVTIGTPRSDLARNLAKIEPRVPNYLYTSLRSNFNFTQAEATDYVAGLVNRQLGSETRMAGLMGMKLTSEAFMKGDPQALMAQLEGIGAERLTREQAQQFLTYGQGQEREVRAFLSQFEKGSVLDLDDLGFSKGMAKTLKDMLGGKSQIFLPGAETLDSLIGHEIRSADKTLNIESEFIRYLADLSSGLSGAQKAGEDSATIDKVMRGLTTTKQNLASVTGLSLRNALSTRILGSGTYSGAGIRFGKEAGAATILSGNPLRALDARNKMLQAFDENKGYVAFMDADAFLDGMLKYEEAVRKDLVRKRGTTAIDKEVEEVMTTSLRDFFLGMHEEKGLKGVSAAAQRNPFISFGHMMPGMSIFRYDFFKQEDKFFGMFKESMGTKYTEGYLDFLKTKRGEIKQARKEAQMRNQGFLRGDESLDSLFKGYKARIAKFAGELTDEMVTNQDAEGKSIQVPKRTGGVINNLYAQMEGAFESFGGSAEEYERLKAEKVRLSEQYEELSAKMPKPLFDVDGNVVKDDKGRIVHEGQADMDAANKAAYEKMRNKFMASEKAMGLRTFENVKQSLAGRDVFSGKMNIPGIDEDMLFRTAGHVSRQDRATLGNQIANNMAELESLKTHERKLDSYVSKMSRATSDEEIEAISKAYDKYEKEISKMPLGDIVDKRSKLEKKQASLLERQARIDTEGFTRRQSINVIQDIFESATGLKSRGETFSPRYFTNENTYRNFLSSFDSFFFGKSLDGGRREFFLETAEGKRVFGLFDALSEGLFKPNERGFINLQRTDMSAGSESVGVHVRSKAFSAVSTLVDTYSEGSTRLDNFFKALSSIGLNNNFEAIQSGKVESLASLKEAQDNFNKVNAQTRKANQDAKASLKEAQEANKKARTPYLEAIERNVQLKEEIELAKVERAEVQKGFEEFKNVVRGIEIDDTGLDLKSLDERFGSQYIGARTESGVRIESAFTRVEESFGKEIQSFSEFKSAVANIESMDAGEAKTQLQEDVRSLFRKLPGKHKAFGTVGGGAVYFPEVNIKANLVNELGEVVGDYSGRMDFTRFAIGDYDADIYQVFFDTDKRMRNAILEGDRHKGLIEYGSKFLVSMSEMGKGMANLGKRMESLSGAQNLLESRIDNATKERFVKAVGNLDVYVKTGMLGLAQAAASDASGDMGKSFGRMSAGAALVSVAQEVLAIKAKKLPVAAGISDQFVDALKTSFETGSGQGLKDFFMSKVLPGTAFEKGKSISLKGIDFTDLPAGAGRDMFESGLTGMKINMDELFEAFDTMAASVKRSGIGNLTSNTRMSRMLSSSSPVSYEQMARLLNMGETMEGGAIMGKDTMMAIQDIFDSVERGSSGVANILPKRGVAGLAAGGLLGAYALGATSGIQRFEGTERFSDMKVKSRPDRGLMKSMGQEHGNVPVGRSMTPDNFYERPINQQQTVVSSGMSSRVYGEAPNLSAAQDISRQMTLSGGRASITINDNRAPIGYSYINKMIRD